MQLTGRLWDGEPKKHVNGDTTTTTTTTTTIVTTNTTHFMLASVVLNLVLVLAFVIQGSSPFPKVLEQHLHHRLRHHHHHHQEQRQQNQLSHCPDWRSYVHKLDSCPAAATHHDDSPPSSDLPVNLDHGDPTMFESYWRGNSGSCTTVILGWEQMSYFASRKQYFWFVESDLEKQIRQLHSLVGNAVTQGKFIVVGTGSTQLFQAALYAASPRTDTQPAKVVSAIPYYSSYPVLTDYLESGIHKWAGDASKFQVEAEGDRYIELVTSPNNPDGTVRHPVVNGSGPVVYDLAYYWPHYTPITSAADHDIMLFTTSKSTGHAGTRIGWAIVKDEQVARKMAKFIELNTIGVSHDSQLRAAQIFKSILKGYHSAQQQKPLLLTDTPASVYVQQGKLFHYGFTEMRSRWHKLRSSISGSDRFSLPDFPLAFCSFFDQVTSAYPAFAWLTCNKESDCEELLRLKGGILSRSGSQFGAGRDHVRISMLDRHQNFETFLTRLAALANE